MQNQRNLGMSTVRVDKARLLDTLNANMLTHIAEYNEAVDGYKDELQSVLKEKLDEVGRNTPQDVVKLDMRIGLETPQSHEKDYKLAIATLEWSIDSHVDLSQHEFNQYVNDEWNWTHNFK